MWVWCDDTREEATDAGLLNAERLIAVPLSSGRPLGTRFPADMVLEFRSRTEPDDFFHAGPAFVVSARLRQLFDEFVVEAEYYPLAVQFRRQASTRHRFWFANLTRAVECLDWEHSRYTAEQEFASTIRQLVLRQLDEPEPPLFRVAHTIPSIACCSDGLAAAVIKGGYTGVRLVSAEEWRNPMWPPGTES